ncbi:TlpA disulfide reductase family protein [Halobacillus sp. BBL2006]|uniref:TlpA family protein disulfide reductase n=1 Tax=Halobacillus sp. BBL2006 TaxID=1543706 RepID=UPI000544084A|nr:TlpA disulfide reductase family protein [Halobacillus sp. BBL2006]KHE68674.1 thioredoxin [Halobacillus sp. BBL2006]
MEKAPLFELPYIHSNETYQLKEDLGKVIVLTFWASWCPDCGKDLPKKEQLFKTMDHEKVKMLTINVVGRERMEEKGIRYAEEFLTQPTLKDRGREVYDLYESEGVPTTIIIDQQGNIYNKFGDKASFLEIVESIGNLI